MKHVLVIVLTVPGMMLPCNPFRSAQKTDHSSLASAMAARPLLVADDGAAAAEDDNPMEVKPVPAEGQESRKASLSALVTPSASFFRRRVLPPVPPFFSRGDFQGYRGAQRHQPYARSQQQPHNDDDETEPEEVAGPVVRPPIPPLTIPAQDLFLVMIDQPIPDEFLDTKRLYNVILRSRLALVSHDDGRRILNERLK